MGDPQMFSINSPMWLQANFAARPRQAETIDPKDLSTQGFDLSNADHGLFQPIDPAIFPSQASGQGQANPIPSVEAEVDREIVERLGCATPRTKECILHLLRKTEDATNSSVPTALQFTDPAVQQYQEPFIQRQDATYFDRDDSQITAAGDDCAMLSPPAHASFAPFDELEKGAPIPLSEPSEDIKNRQRPHTLPTPSSEAVLAARRIAEQPHFSAPESHTVHAPKNALGSSSMSSQSRLYKCECESTFSTNGDLRRHQDNHCSLTQDKIQYTCLLDVAAPTCFRPCSKHSNGCAATCSYRPIHDESLPTLYQNRADKMRYHLRDCHGWTNFSQGDIPKAWMWPLRRVTSADGYSGPVWVCALCNTTLGRWEENSALIHKHIEDCEEGADARAKRFPRHNGPKLKFWLARGLVGSHMREDDDEAGEYGPTSKNW